MLKPSAITCKFTRSVTGICLAMRRSIWKKPGWLKALRPRSPVQPVGGTGTVALGGITEPSLAKQFVGMMNSSLPINGELVAAGKPAGTAAPPGSAEGRPVEGSLIHRAGNPAMALIEIRISAVAIRIAVVLRIQQRGKVGGIVNGVRIRPARNHFKSVREALRHRQCKCVVKRIARGRLRVHVAPGHLHSREARGKSACSR